VQVTLINKRTKGAGACVVTFEDKRTGHLTESRHELLRIPRWRRYHQSQLSQWATAYPCKPDSLKQAELIASAE
jgi:hypothetical protein